MNKMCRMALAALTIAAVASGCGSGGGSSECSEIWVDGKTLPEGYDGCMQDGSLVLYTATQCDDGTERVTFNSAGEFWADADGLISAGELPDEEYAACTGN